MALPITTVLVSVFALILIWLKFSVIALRTKHGVSLGDGGNSDLNVARRIHANFTENAPFILAIVAVLEFGGAPKYLVMGLALWFVLARLLHTVGMKIEKAPNAPRVMGVMGTTLGLVVGAGYALYMVLL